jgi:8-hydroxy-5-deazaflavin:NADPH oxidoreductase
MRVGILGSGRVGRTLGAGFAAHGHEVAMGTRTPDGPGALEFLETVGERGWVDTYAAVAEWCEFAVFPPVWSAAAHLVELAGAEHLAGKVVVDVTNPLGRDAEGHEKLAVGPEDSAGETVQRLLPDARVVKAFNMTGVELMVSPNLPGGPPTMLIAGNDENAKELVAEVLHDFGWESADLGDITGSRAIEGVTLAWLLYGRRRGTWDHSFKMLHG